MTAPAGGHWVVLTVPHAEGVTENFARELAFGLQANGRSASVVTLGADVGEQLRHANAMAAEGVISIGPVPLALTVGGTPLYLALPGRVYLYCLDTPIYDLMKVPAAGRFIADAWQHARLVPLLAEKTFLDDLSAGAAPLLPPQSAYLPFAAFPDRGPKPPVPVQRRLLLIGALGAELSQAAVRPDLLQTLRDANAPGLGSNDLVRATEHLLAPQARGNVMADLFAILGLAPRAALTPEVQTLVCAADSFIKRHRRLLAVNALRGVPLDIAGPGWEALFGSQPDFRFLGAVPHRQLARLMRLYRGVVNLDPNWEWGAHDRVFTAAAMGVPVLTHANRALADEGLPAALALPYAPNSPQLAATSQALLDRTDDTLPAHGVDWTARMARLLRGPARATRAAPAAEEITP